MQYFALACDYDGTLAAGGQAQDEAIGAIERLLHSGRKFVLVTGRELPELLEVFDRHELCDWIVAENGALLYKPSTKEKIPLGPAPLECFVKSLREASVPISVGASIVATVQPYEQAVLEAIRVCGLELQVIFNKGAVMVLPSGVNKATGLAAALERLALSPHNVVCIGDGENDHALLAHGEVGVAVENAVTMLKQGADWVTPAANGQGVTALIDRMLSDDLAFLDEKLTRHDILLGHREDGAPVSIRPHGRSMLIAGTSGGGKSTLATALLERLAEQGYQYCVIDPEGDYQDLDGAITLGDVQTPPTDDAMTKLLEQTKQNVVVNLVGVRFEDRTAAFLKLFSSIVHLRRQYGRPHFVLIDEAHHVLPAAPEAWRTLAPGAFDQTCLITLEPDLVAAPALKAIDLVIGIGRSTDRTLTNFAKTVGLRDPRWKPIELEKGQMVAWNVYGGAPFVMQLAPGHTQLRRHGRKYAEGELGPMRSFFFRGPAAKLNLRAQNLVMFTQIAEGVDDETWLHHLRQGDYSTWFREGIKDARLGDEAAAVEADERLSAEESRKQIRRLVEKYYTLPGGQGQPPVDGPPASHAAETLAADGAS